LFFFLIVGGKNCIPGIKGSHFNHFISRMKVSLLLREAIQMIEMEGEAVYGIEIQRKFMGNVSCPLTTSFTYASFAG
jgi:hypothetical protein